MAILTGALAIVFIFGTLFVAAIVWAVRLLRGNSTPSGGQRQEEEAKLIQELYQGLARMEERVDALETILFDRKRKDREQ